MNPPAVTHTVGILADRKSRLIKAYVNMLYHATVDILQNHDKIHHRGLSKDEDFTGNRTVHLKMPEYQPYWEVVNAFVSEIRDCAVVTVSGSHERDSFMDKCVVVNDYAHRKHYDGVDACQKDARSLKAMFEAANIYVVLCESDYHAVQRMLTGSACDKINYAVLFFEQAY